MPKLSLVIAAYDIPRQLTRTIQSLSPPLQRGVDPSQYELIVVDNGSEAPPDREACEAFGARLRWLRLDDAPPSPARALNLGIAAARAPLVGAMVDGARLASPRLLEQALLAARADPRPVIGTVGFHLGSEPQQQAVQAGYDEAAEAALLAEVEWTADGYRLFDVSVPGLSAGDDWLGVPTESNAIFMPTALWGELAGFDERFAAPGGGLVNLDLFDRACSLPDSRLIMLLGEATFHQVHGGVSTNSPEPRYAEFHAEYVRLRGHELAPPRVRPLHIGSPSPEAIAALRRWAAPAAGHAPVGEGR